MTKRNITIIWFIGSSCLFLISFGILCIIMGTGDVSFTDNLEARAWEKDDGRKVECLVTNITFSGDWCSGHERCWEATMTYQYENITNTYFMGNTKDTSIPFDYTVNQTIPCYYNPRASTISLDDLGRYDHPLFITTITFMVASGVSLLNVFTSLIVYNINFRNEV